ncbi:hypothetical protein NQ318_012222 [Aromia moschata]|uniref:UDP-glucuronosyltransferase n=1 Tax=Aromia moschata TaxID=1265417 RepID=A0AAV8YM74_9CUCU|nr:hypothetical protein NQ318_012222 [Aromia moschata]
MHLLTGTVFLAIYFSLLAQDVRCANILFVTLFPSISHQKVFQQIWKELSLRRHNVHAVATNPLRDPSLTNLTEYDISSHYEVVKRMAGNTDLRDLMLKKPNFFIVFLKDIILTGKFSELCEITFSHPEVQRLLKTNIQFDVVLVEWLFPTMAGFGAKYNCPMIGVTSLGAPLVALDTVGNPSHPIIAPDHNLPVTRDMTFQERVLSTLYAVYVRFWYHMVVLPREDKLVKKYLGEDLPYLGDIERNVSLLLLNRNPIFHRAMPVVPAVIELGTTLVNRERPDIEASKQGVIYFSLGSNMKSIYLPDQLREIILAVFGRLPYNVVMKWENDTLLGKPDNVFISKWFPQLSLLEHPNIRLFIMQGGLQSSEEAIVAQVPIIGFPTHSDSMSNVDSFVKYGAGIALDFDYLTAESFDATIRKIMTTPSYKENAKGLAKLMYDQPIDGLQKAIWWIEYVIRHKGAKHLRSPVLEVPWWQYFLLDIVGFLTAVLILILVVGYFFLKVVYLWLKKLKRSFLPMREEDEEKKNQ